MLEWLRLPSVYVLLITLGSAFGQTYAIKTFAGAGLPENIPGTYASFVNPAAVAVDPSGNVFVSDSQLNAVFRLDGVTGVVTVAAGNGTRGFSGDGGPATNAELANPGGIAIDAAGNLFIADTARIRKVSNGVIATVAGNGTAGFSGDNGSATSAEVGTFGSAPGVAVDLSGNLYIIDGFRIREVSNGVITTIAGTGFEGLSGDGGPAIDATMAPEGIAVDASGDIYIAESANARVREISNGVIDTIAGGGPIGYLGDNGPATSANIGFPQGVALDQSGNLYIADGRTRVREVINGTITTVAGNGTFSPFIDNVPATTGSLNYPVGVAVDSSGNVYIADSFNYRIRKVSNGTISTVAGNGSQGFRGDNGPATAAQVDRPGGLATDASSDLFLVDSPRIREVSNGVISTVAGNGILGISGDNGPAVKAALNPTGIAVDTAGNLYIADAADNRVREVSSGVITTVAGTGSAGFSGDNGPAASAQLSGPQGVAVDAAGNLYIADARNFRIREVSNGVMTTVAGPGLYPFAVAVDASGSIYMTDNFNFRISKVANGVTTAIAGNGSYLASGDNGPATNAGLGTINAIAVDALGNVYLAGNGIRKISNGIITTIFTIGGPFASALGGVAVDKSFNVYFSDSANKAVEVLIPSGTPCSASVSPIAQTLPNGGGSLSVSINTDEACPWAIQNLPQWVTYTGDAVGSGNAIITLTAALNPGVQRSAILSIAGVSITLAQDGNPLAPVIATNGIVPLDSSVPTIQPGSWISIFGTNLSTATASWNGDFPTSLGGVTVTIDGKAGYLSYVSPTQINLQAPDDTATGAVIVVVTSSIGSTTSTVTLAPYAPSLSLFDSRYAAVVIPTPDGSGAYGNGSYDLGGPAGRFSFSTRPVKPGEVIELYGVGFGPTNPPVSPGMAFNNVAPTTGPVTVTIGGVPSTVLFSAITSAGLYQLNVVVPSTLSSGDQVVIATVGVSFQTPQGIDINVQ